MGQIYFKNLTFAQVVLQRHFLKAKGGGYLTALKRSQFCWVNRTKLLVRIMYTCYQFSYYIITSYYHYVWQVEPLLQIFKISLLMRL